MTRKEFLKIGTALPIALHSLNLRAAEKPKIPPKRVMFICNSLGFYESHFFPKTRGDLSTSTYLNRIKTKDKVTVFENLFHPGMSTSNHDSEKSFLTGAPNPESTTFTNSISLDQLLAQHMGGDTRYPSLPLSIYDRGWGCSWNSRGGAIPPIYDEALIFNKLFGEEDLAAKKRQIANDQNVVRCLYRDMEQLKTRGAGASKLDSYRTIIRELEAQLKHEEFWLNAKKPIVVNTLSDDSEFAFSTKIKNLLELSKLAFQTDSTRVITFTMDWINGAINVPGATGGWHTLSHHGNQSETIEKLTRIEVDIVKHLNQFLFELDQIKEGDGSLLDNTTVVIGSNFGDASNHTHNNLPTIIAGGGYRHQGHTVLERPTPLCNLYLELMHRHNIDAASFGSSEHAMGLLKG
ncbi:DUF1552 domain-containing protein [bacterium]|jgi:hypothetical protein|nr:DUF1552 domain-containing protein [bacterium]MDF1786631.1 DUF1552 domain-containing protein [Verrucomicrobiales bacterium]